MKPYIIESCVDSLEKAIEAEKKGADQIELCENLNIGGTSPNWALVKTVKQKLSIPIKILIRPRGGDFVYNDSEIQQMKSTIAICRYIGVQGVVVGALQAGGNKLNLEVILSLCESAYPLDVTIHKAIDLCDNPVEEMKRLKKIKQIKYILTSGKAATAFEGIDTLKSMIQHAEDGMDIIAAGKITHGNLNRLHNKLKAKYYHGRAIV